VASESAIRIGLDLEEPALRADVSCKQWATSLGSFQCRWPPVALIVTSGRRSVLETDVPHGGRFLDKPYEPAQIEAALRELIC
jgi:hypothetical protein